MKPKKYNQFLALTAAAITLSAMANVKGAEMTNVDTSHAQSVSNLTPFLNGGLPTAIQTVIDNIAGYKALEDGKLTTLSQAEKEAQKAVDDKNQEITDKGIQIGDLIAADPLDPQIVIEQGNLETLQGELPDLNTTLAGAKADVQNSVNKVTLYDQCLKSPIKSAETAVKDARSVLDNAIKQYGSGGDKNDTNYAATKSSGLQSVIDKINSVTAGNQDGITTAITDADSAFTAIGAADATVADIQALVGVIDAQLPTLPPISDADKTTVLDTVLNGSYERNAIDLNTTDITALDAQVNDASTGLAATKAIADGTKAKVDNETTGLAATKAIADGTKAKVDNETTGLAATKKIADDEVVARTALIRRESDGIHIGENSLITNEVGGVQQLFAEDVLGAAIDINVTNGSDLRVNGVSVATDADVTTERNARIAADNSIRSEFAAADKNLRNDIDTNTRGIAMVAAMTNTTIQPGMTHGVDFNISQFESETGFAFGYAHRINENVQVHGSAASTADFDESVGRLGVSFQW